MRFQSIAMSLATVFVGTSLAQQPDTSAAKQERIAALKQSLAKNRAALKQYTWTETTQISLKGEVKKQEQKQCQYGPDGKVQKTPMQGVGEPQAPQESSGRGGRRGGRLKEEIVEKKVGEMKDYMQRVAALVHEYVPPDPQKIQAAQAAGNLALTPAQPVSTITIKNYLKQGDSVTIGFDTTAKAIASYNVDSYLDNPKDDPVKLAVNFARLPDGTNYAQQSVLDATGKKIEVKVTNSDYKKLTQ
ncbi:MAG TPA: hypothetical protein VH640_06710 [Bryobacteraceae bacterium]